MLLMLVCAMMTSISIVREKERGTMELLLVSPVRPLMIMIAKVVPYLVLAFAILTTILLMARYILDVPLAGSIVWIYVISTIYIILALSLGLLISTIATTQLMALLLSAMVFTVALDLLCKKKHLTKLEPFVLPIAMFGAMGIAVLLTQVLPSELTEFVWRTYNENGDIVWRG